jgi:AcrR family transcriptional regulator
MKKRKTVVDRRAQRTRRALRDALLSLLTEKSWDELSVQDLCTRADIGRSTFYLHFPSKEALLSGSLDDLRGALNVSTAADAERGKAGPLLPFVHGLLEHLYEQQRLCRSIFGRRSSQTVQKRFREMVGELVADSLRGQTPASWKREAAASYLAGALVEMLAWWIDSRPMRPIDELEEFYLRLAEPVVRELMRG